MTQIQATGDGAAVPERPRPRSGVETAYLSPAAVLYDDASGTVVHLNASAAAIWMTLDGRLDVGGIASELSQVFDVPPDTLRPDIDAALRDFARRNLIVEGA